MNLDSISIKIGLYILFFVSAIQDKHIVHWFNMTNMTNAMILMSVVMIVDKGWDLIHAE